MSHTPGPWCQDKWGSLKTESGKDVLLRGITTISAGSDERIAEAEANTRLISAAPDLLYALQVAITSMLDSGYSPKCATITLARSAISKAIDA